MYSLGAKNLGAEFSGGSNSYVNARIITSCVEIQPLKFLSNEFLTNISAVYVYT